MNQYDMCFGKKETRERKKERKKENTNEREKRKEEIQIGNYIINFF